MFFFPSSCSHPLIYMDNMWLILRYWHPPSMKGGGRSFLLLSLSFSLWIFGAVQTWHQRASWAIWSQVNISKYVSSHLALECISTCVSSDHLWSDLASPLCMQINTYIVSVCRDQMRGCFYPAGDSYALPVSRKLKEEEEEIKNNTDLFHTLACFRSIRSPKMFDAPVRFQTSWKKASWSNL